MNKWFWLPDWASDLSLWEDDLVSADSEADHIFVPYNDMAKHLENPYDIKGLAKASTVVGWGLGALTLLKNADRKPQDQKWFLLSPFANFCCDDSNWTDQTLVFMARQVKNTEEPVLNAFSEFLEDEIGDWQDDWRKSAEKMDKNALSAGLNYLVQNQVTATIDNSSDIKVLYGRMDQATPPAMTLALKELLPEAEFKERPKAGHWPPLLML